jgi:glycosyltransferase involved in cell wall biosynthesis
MNVIASQRALGYANHFKKFGYYPTIITHQWEKSLQEQFCEPNEILQKTIKEENENYTVYRMPIGQFKRGKFLKRIEKSFLNKLGILLSWMFGHLDTRGELLNNKLTERYFLKEHLKNKQYDVVIGIFSPHYHLSNCAWLYKKFKTHYVLDYRDLWSNRIIHKKYNPNFTEKTQDFFSGFWWKKWAIKSMSRTITSRDWANTLENIVNQKVGVITNGFEKSFFDNSYTKKNDIFTIVHNGSIYRHQNLDIFLRGYSQFLNKNKDANIIVEFIGSRRKIYSEVQNGFLNPEELEHSISTQYLTFTERIPYQESISKTMSSNLLLSPSFPDSPGTYGGKIFEYLMTKKNIIVVPDDEGVISEIVKVTKSGICLNNEDEVLMYLEEKYNEWQEKGYCEYNGEEEKVNLYSRENQTKLLSELITQNLN